MAKRSPSGVLVAAVIWLIIIGAVAVAYRQFLQPMINKRLNRMTGSESRYREEVTVALDSFSGYAVLRSEDMAARLKAQGIRLELKDDGADYIARAKALRDGSAQMAVFTIDSLLTACAAIGDFPATIVMVIDETRGADAMVAYKEGIASLQDLNNEDARIVLTPNSPSEFLARIAIAHFSLPQLPRKWMIEEDGAGDVYKAFKAADERAKRAYVMWEPYVSRALEEPGAVVLLDSSRLQGYIMDVLVVQREFLRDKPEVVQAVVETYLRTAYACAQNDGMVDLVVRDAKQTGTEGLSKSRAEKLVDGIAWKNTLENYAHFGLLSESEAKGLGYLEDSIEQIVDVLVRTGALDRDPLDGQANTLFYAKLLRDLKASGFHPGKEVNILNDVGMDLASVENVRGADELRPLSSEEWARIVNVGEMQVDAISFARGTARLNLSGERSLARLAQQMRSFPQYYLRVVGHARAEGDMQANIALAEERAATAVEYLVREGLSPNRIKAESMPPKNRTGEAQSVTFEVGQLPY